MTRKEDKKMAQSTSNVQNISKNKQMTKKANACSTRPNKSKKKMQSRSLK